MFACLHAPGNLPLLLECAQAFSPQVEETSPDTVLLDIAGLDHLFGTPRQIAKALARRNGVGASIAIAANPDAAIHAARGFPGITTIPPGSEAAVLAPLPLNLLGGSPDTAGILDQWGIRTFGELAALPDLGIAARLGPEGVHLQKLARGEGDRPLRPPETQLCFEEEFELEHPVDLLEPLSFLLARLLNGICASLESRALAANQLRLRLQLEDETGYSLTLNLPVPMRDARAFGKLLQLNLSAHPPQSPVTKIHLAAEPVKPRFEQHGLFLPCSPEPEKMELTLLRLANLVGGKNAGTPKLLDTHRPDAFSMERFAAIQKKTGVPSVTCPATCPRAVLRRFRPPKHVQVRNKGAQPLYISGLSFQGEVIACAGPWRVSGDWWTSEPWNRDEWDVALSDGALYRLHRDLQTNRWFAEGIYD
ncbi:MAG: DNA polymerase Y family protein [Acidobacteriota bacterium]|nr:DNA polymerase Y family protein [Acidobacteriota bacterium]